MMMCSRLSQMPRCRSSQQAVMVANNPSVKININLIGNTVEAEAQNQPSSASVILSKAKNPGAV